WHAGRRATHSRHSETSAGDGRPVRHCIIREYRLQRLGGSRPLPRGIEAENLPSGSCAGWGVAAVLLGLPSDAEVDGAAKREPLGRISKRGVAVDPLADRPERHLEADGVEVNERAGGTHREERAIAG